MDATRLTVTALRDYQNEAFEAAKDKNALIVLPTNSGKTLISAAIIKHKLSTGGSTKKRALFLVPSVVWKFDRAR
jgi:endoribonuclease Dicer